MGLSLLTALTIQGRGNDIRPMAYPLKTGGFMPVIKLHHGGEAWQPLVTWDKTSEPDEASALARAQTLIDEVRKAELPDPFSRESSNRASPV